MDIESIARLLVSLALIVGALLFVRAWAQRRGLGSGPGMRVLARTGVTRTASVAIVQVDGRRFLVGAGDQGVRLLTELDADGLEVLNGSAVPDTVPQEMTPGATDWRFTADRPWMGLIDRLRGMTVRTHLERPTRAAPDG